MIPYSNQLKDYEFDIETVKSHHKKNGRYKVTYYNNSIITFDIETTSAWIENGKVIAYAKGKTEDYWNNLEPICLCYIWQLSVDGTVYYGRELRDFLQVLKDINSKYETIIWVHNLSFEFSFLSGILKWGSVFARSPHKPMKCKPLDYPNIEFRCTYMLTRLSLETWGEQIGVEKKVGDLDYDILRTPLTPMNETELGYCETDCLVVEAGIKEYKKKYGSLRNIPLTQTGTVRLEVKNRLTADSDYVKFIKKLVPRSADEYKMLQNIFAGGYTHANRFWSGKIIKDKISHFDFASSYPTVMICEKFPSTPWMYTGWKDFPYEENFDNYAYIIHVIFKNIQCQTFNTYIQASKCVSVLPKLDNGRIMSAKEVTMWITEQDYITIKNTYTWEEAIVDKVYESKKDYLPYELRKYILELYKNKTELKDVDGMEDLYMQSKQYINSMFGMCVTAIVQSDCEYSNDEWHIKALVKDFVERKLEQLRNFNPREKRYFLSYSWGCWVTAYARRNLWKCMETVDHDVLYVDTDSIFVLGQPNFEWYNKEITEKLYKSCIETGLNFEDTRPKTKKGKPKPLGVFAEEPICTEFITLGAKRYCERREDGKLYLTISGINKGAVELLENKLENFKDGFTFDKDAECVTKKMHTYRTDMKPIRWNDGYISTYTHGINLRRCGYTLGVSDDYKELISYIEDSEYEIPDYVDVMSRGRWVG